MNRVTVLLLAMAALLVHVLVVHRDGLGGFGPPFDSAHVAYRIGRNLAREGTASWWVDAVSGAREGSLASYPSPLLVWIAAVIEWFERSVTRASQFIGVACALITVVVSTRFDTNRIAGVVPALLLVSSGAVAAAGASGTEWPLAMALLVTSFVALEHGRQRVSTLALALLVVCRPEGIVCAAVLFVQTVLRRRSRDVGARVPSLVVFAPAVGAIALATWLGSHIAADALRPFALERGAAWQGALQLRDFVVSTGSPLLLVFPLVALLKSELSSVGRRALVLAGTWAAAAALSGGGPAPYDLAFTPTLPIMFIAIQQGMARALDTYRRSMEQLVWLALGLAIAASLLASRFPGNLGEVNLRRVQERIYRAHAQVPPGQVELLARSSLHSEIRLTTDLRRIGTFLRDRLPEDATILTPWPGSLGYLSRRRVIDLFGRTSARDGHELAPWAPEPAPLDLRWAAAVDADYILPTVGGLQALTSGHLASMLPESIFALDPTDGPDLRNEITSLLARYELVVTTGEVREVQFEERRDWAAPLVLLRRRGLQAAPDLVVTEMRGYVCVLTGFPAPSAQTSVEERPGLPQVFDARIVVVSSDGSRTLIDPVGRGLPDHDVAVSLAGIVVDPRWPSRVTLARIQAERLVEEHGAVRLEARLLHHGAPIEDPASDATGPIVVPLR